MRLDDAAYRMDIEKWNQMEQLLDKYQIIPLVGIIPQCEDENMMHYSIDKNFWNRVNRWKQKGWILALHGYKHIYCTKDGGINPVNRKSEFAGISLEEQKEKIRRGVNLMRRHQIDPKVFFAPSHTFDLNTIKALKEESNIRIISDTVASDRYCKYGMTFVPQQSGRVRKLPFRIVTFCYHPNICDENDFYKLEKFLKKNHYLFMSFPLELTERKRNTIDVFLSKLYFARRKNDNATILYK